jgi:hypothetical protein
VVRCCGSPAACCCQARPRRVAWVGAARQLSGTTARRRAAGLGGGQLKAGIRLAPLAAQSRQTDWREPIRRMGYFIFSDGCCRQSGANKKRGAALRDLVDRPADARPPDRLVQRSCRGTNAAFERPAPCLVIAFCGCDRAFQASGRRPSQHRGHRCPWRLPRGCVH